MNRNNPVRLPPYKVLKVVHTLSQSMGWGISQLNVPQTWTITQGDNIVVMVIDTGYSDHPDLGNAVIKDSCRSFVSYEPIVTDYNGHSCVTADTKIFTNFCGLQKIETLFDNIDSNNIGVTNDSVIKDISDKNIKTISYYNKQHTLQKIQAVHRIKYNGELIRVLYGANKKFPLSIALTPWHPMYINTSRGSGFTVKKINADQLKIGDNLIRNSTCMTPATEYRYIEYDNEKIILDEDFAWFLGIILTDGHIWTGKNAQYRIDLDQCNENKEVIVRFEKICNKLGINCLTYSFKNNKTRVYFNNKKWWSIITQLIPSGNKTKRIQIPQLITKSPLTVCMSFIAGLIDGDGYVSKADGRIKIVSSCKEFIENLRLFLVTIGMPSVSIIHNKAHPNKFCDVGCEMWQVKFKDGSDLLKKYITITRKKEALNKGHTKIHKVYKILDIQKEYYKGYLYDFTVENSNNYIANGIIASNTHCQGIIGARNNEIGCVGVAPQCKLIAVKVLDTEGSGDMEGICDALEYALQIKPHIISMSLGAPSGTTRMHNIIKKLYEANISLVCAAGNDGRGNSINYPAKYPETICVTAFDKNDNPASFNSTGNEAEFSAPGVDIYSTWLNHEYAVLSGTCLAKGTKVYTVTGLKNIEDVVVGEEVFCLNEQTHKIENKKVIETKNNGIKQLFEIITDHSTIKATDNHPFLVKDKNELKWKTVAELTDNDKIATVKQINYTSQNTINSINKALEYKHIELTNYLKQTSQSNIPLNSIKITDEFCQFIGAFLGDGYIHTNKFAATGLAGLGLCVRYGYKQQNKDLPLNYANLFEKAFNLPISIRESGDLFIYSEYLANIFKELDLFETSHTKRIPYWVYALPKQQKIRFLSGLIDTDGWIGSNGNLGFELCNKNLLLDIICLCNMIGLKFANFIERETTKFNLNPNNGKTYNSYASVSSQIKNFEDSITIFDDKYKKFLMNRIPCIEKNEKYINSFEKYLRTTDIIFERIKEINVNKEDVVYDLTIEDNHNFVAEGLIVHNSMSTPFMSGVIALLLAKHRDQEAVTGQNDCKTVEQVREHLKKYANDKGVTGKDDVWGYGVVSDVAKLIREDAVDNPPNPEPPPPPVPKKKWWFYIIAWFFGTK